MDWNARIRAALTSSAAMKEDEDVIEELAQHARAIYDAARADGCLQEEAEARVSAQIGRWQLEAAALRHKSRRQAPVEPPPSATSSWLASLAQDTRYAARLIRRQPRFALLVIFTMALGVGATTTLFSVAAGVLMKPLPWLHADRVVVLKETRGGTAPRFGSFSNTAYLAWRDQASTIEEIAAWTPQTFTLTGAGDPERVRMTAASASLFRVLGIRPSIGSVFTDAEETSPVVVLSEGLWRQRFGADRNVLGRIVQLDGQPRTVVGVVSDALAYPDRLSRGWVPLRVPPPSGSMLRMFEAVGRLGPGATPEQAAAEGSARGRFAADTGMTTTAIFGSNGPVGVSARSLSDAMTAEVRRPLIILLVAVSLLLAIATSNIASLQLARATARRRELAIRAALGASSGRVIRQLVVESLLLGGAGGAAGFSVAWMLHRAAAWILPADFPRVHEVALDARVVLFTIVTSGAVSLIFGLWPAFRLRRLNLVESLAEDGASPSGVGTRSGVARSRLLIISGQVAIACVLLVGASLLGRSFVELLHADRGFDPSRVLSAAVPMPGPAYTPERRVVVLQAILDRLRTMPGVRQAGFTSEAPLTPGGSTSSLTLPSRDSARGMVAVQASPRLVSPGYFSALGLSVVAGRSLEVSDTETSQPVAVVNETFARRYLGDEPLGATIPMGVWGGSQTGEATIVGVVEDIRYVNASGAGVSLPEMYFSYRQLKVGMRSTIATLLIRGDENPMALVAAVRHVIREADGALGPGSIMTLEDRLLSTSLARPRLYAVLLAGFAGVALVVTGVGLFGVLSYIVTQRTRELGLRAALGARRSDLVVLVMRQGMGVALAGVAAGLLASMWLTRYIAALLYGVTASDWMTYVAVPLVLLAVAALACLAPARRAARLDPLRALRS
jgi:predicted permease